jgi:hypothetical protein
MLLPGQTKAVLPADTVDPSLYQDLRYRLIGPFRASRTTGWVGIASQPNAFSAGAHGGGVWRMDDHGHTWKPIIDDAPTGSVGDIAVSPSHPNILYVRTGEGLHRPDLGVGDVIHLDCGSNYLGFANDWQRVAYTLLEGEEDVPEGLKVALPNANIVQEASAPRPGMTGFEAAAAATEELQGIDFLPSFYSHSLGYHGHTLGPSINARNGILGDPRRSQSRLRVGSHRAVELNAKSVIPEWNGDSLLVPMEHEANLTANGFEWVRPIQTEWYLIR